MSRLPTDERSGPFGQLSRFVGGIILSTVIASLVVAPFGIYHFHNTQMLALIANVFAIPICNIVVMPAALAVLLALPLGLEWLPLAVMGWGIDAMTAVARWVGALPGAVVKVPAIPAAAFALMIAGGLWLLLWRRPWRLFGLIPTAIGLLLAPTLEKPDLLIGRDGTTIAIRGADGRLTALASRGSSFELARWLELDGDRRSPVDVATAAAFRCDSLGCLASVAGKRVAVAASPAALSDDCRLADVLILRVVAPRRCGRSATPRGQIVIDPVDVARSGAHAIYVNGAVLRVETVAGARGQRPWSGPLAPPLAVDRAAIIPAGNRLHGFSGLFERFRPARPETEDDGGQPP